ncbi:hypothetical protein ES703_10155 [subsurface metagenome]
MTWWNIGLIFVMIVVGSLLAGFVETWLEQRKWNKKGGDAYTGSNSTTQ